jgi:hypothetical protein
MPYSHWCLGPNVPRLPCIMAIACELLGRWLRCLRAAGLACKAVGLVPEAKPPHRPLPQPCSNQLSTLTSCPSSSSTSTTTHSNLTTAPQPRRTVHIYRVDHRTRRDRAPPIADPPTSAHSVRSCARRRHSDTRRSRRLVSLTRQFGRWPPQTGATGATGLSLA